jgi:hypothetical protein
VTAAAFPTVGVPDVELEVLFSPELEPAGAAVAAVEDRGCSAATTGRSLRVATTAAVAGLATAVAAMLLAGWVNVARDATAVPLRQAGFDATSVGAVPASLWARLWCWITSPCGIVGLFGSLLVWGCCAAATRRCI